MKKLTKRTLQAIKTKNKIAEVALPMIREKGFDNVSIDDICLAAGIAKGTFYHYFETKEKVLGLTAIMLSDQELNELLENKQVSSIDKIIFIVDAYMELANKEGADILRHLFKSFLDGSNVFSEETTGRQVMRAVVAEGIARKEFDPNLTAEEIVDFTFTFTAGEIFFWCNSNGSYDIRARAHRLLEKWAKVTLAKKST